LAAKDGTQRNVLSPSHVSGPSFPHPISEHAHHGGGGSQLQNINDRVTMPYDYTEGYHFLMKHLPSRCVAKSGHCAKKECLWDSSSDFLPFMIIWVTLSPPLI